MLRVVLSNSAILSRETPNEHCSRPEAGLDRELRHEPSPPEAQTRSKRMDATSLSL